MLFGTAAIFVILLDLAILYLTRKVVVHFKFTKTVAKILYFVEIVVGLAVCAVVLYYPVRFHIYEYIYTENSSATLNSSNLPSR